jgi:fatty acid desaturase
MFKYSKWDGLLVILTLVQLGLLTLPFLLKLSLPILIFVSIVNIFLMGTNFQCMAHNFIHLPFFNSPKLNNLFSIINSLGIAVPQSMYRIHHLNHHRFNNRPEADESSTFRYGKNNQEENIFSYSFLGIFRTDMTKLYKQSLKTSSLVILELMALSFYVGILLTLNWKLFLFYLVPNYLGGHFFALWENYCEHHHTNPYDRKRDSVSCYSRIYNLLWFNNGFHQEHHFSPQVHWTEIPKVKAELPEDRVIVRGCHLSNSF